MAHAINRYTNSNSRLPLVLKPAASGRDIVLVGHEHPRRQEVEQFIADRFFESHRATITSFMPLLIGIMNAENEFVAAVGIREADEEALFLEHYFDLPIERVINACAPIEFRPVQRSGIVEIGNLASISRDASRGLFAQLAQFLDRRGFEWAVFTGCSSLRKMFRCLGIEIVELGRAAQTLLPAAQQTWGSYYEDNPVVVAGRVCNGRVLAAGPTAAVDGGQA